MVAGRGSEVSTLEVGRRVVVKPPIACGICHSCERGEDDSCPSLHNVGVHRWGGHAEYVTVPERSVFPIADSLGHAQATALAHSFPVAEQMFTRVGLTGDDVVLVTGASGAIGFAGVQLATLAGAVVIGAAGSPDRASQAAAAGADATIDYTAEPEFSDSVREIAPEGVTVYLEPASNPTVWNEALKTLRNRARVVVMRIACGTPRSAQQQLAVQIAGGDLREFGIHQPRYAAVSRSGGNRQDPSRNRLRPAPTPHPGGLCRPPVETQRRQDRATGLGQGRIRGEPA